MEKQDFEAEIKSEKSRTFIVIPFDPNKMWNKKDKHYIKGEVAGHMIRGPLRVDGDRYITPLGPAWMRDSGLEPGASVQVSLAPEGPQVEKLAEDITSALVAEPNARAFFESLATFYRKKYLKWVDGARRPEVRASRIKEMVRLLKSGQREK